VSHGRPHTVVAAIAACLLTPLAVHAKLANPALTEIQELAEAGRSNEALRRIDALIAKDPQDPQLRFQKGVLLVEQKRTAEAIALFERMGRDFPTLPEPLNNLAVLYAEQGQIEKARAALESAVRSRPSYDTAYQNLASVNVRLASRAYARALQIDDSGGAPRLALLKNLQGSHQDSPVLLASAPVSPPGPTPPPPPAPPAAASPATPPPAPSPAPPENRGSPAEAMGNGAPAANPATADSAQRRTTETASEVNAAVRAWASAWERKDLDDYIGAYVPGFRGTDGSASEWQRGRRQRIVGKSRISVDLSGVTVELLPDNVARVSFRQDYAADQLRVSSRKQLELVRREGKWLIRKETVL